MCVCMREREGWGERGREKERQRIRYPLFSSSLTKHLRGDWPGATKAMMTVLLCCLSRPTCPDAGRHHYTSCTHQPSASRNCRVPLPRSQSFPLETCPLGTSTCTPSSSMSASRRSTAVWAAAGGRVWEPGSGVGEPPPASLVSPGLSSAAAAYSQHGCLPKVINPFWGEHSLPKGMVIQYFL